MLCDFTMIDQCGGQIRGKKVPHNNNRATLTISDDVSDAVLILSKKQMRELVRKLLTMSEEMDDE